MAIYILTFFLAYFAAFSGLIVHCDVALDEGVFTEEQYRQHTRYAFIPVVNLVLLGISLADWLARIIARYK
jgi:hypothetical protein